MMFCQLHKVRSRGLDAKHGIVAAQHDVTCRVLMARCAWAAHSIVDGSTWHPATRSVFGHGASSHSTMR